MSDPGRPLWSGRFSKQPALEAAVLGRSLSFDVRLAPQDVKVSIAHVLGLRDAGLIAAEEAEALERALLEVGEEIAAGRFAFDAADEDVHSAIERGVTERLGEVGAKLHAGRSRNDLVVTDLRLWLLDAWGRVEAGVVRVIRALVRHAREHAETVMPGTTHGRAAQPVTLGHHLLAHAWALVRDLDRFRGWAGRASVSALGAGALATSTLGLDPTAAARRLGFADRFANSIDAVSDRDFAQEFLADAAILGTHLSRLAADLLRWSDEALGWVEIDEAYATGSSMMPHKRNPDVPELVRAKAGRLAGHLVALSSTLHGLPLGYHRDLQEDKEPLFDCVDTLQAVLPALAGCVETASFRLEPMRRAARDSGLYATDLAEALVVAGVPFREAHRRVGELVARLETEGRSLADLGGPEWAELDLPEGPALLDPDRAVRARGVPGGPSPESVRGQIEALERRLAARDGEGRGP
jgi:argininosuccinate lyase